MLPVDFSKSTRVETSGSDLLQSYSMRLQETSRGKNKLSLVGVNQDVKVNVKKNLELSQNSDTLDRVRLMIAESSSSLLEKK